MNIMETIGVFTVLLIVTLAIAYIIHDLAEHDGNEEDDE